ncbi:hypothetical protein ABTM72_20280, partial [Acinetobacter baumannii]
ISATRRRDAGSRGQTGRDPGGNRGDERGPGQDQDGDGHEPQRYLGRELAAIGGPGVTHARVRVRMPAVPRHGRGAAVE